MKAATRLLLIVISCLGFGCSATMQAYDGSKRDRREVAVIKAQHQQDFLFFTDSMLEISSVDGIGRRSKSWGIVDNVEVLPGKHRVDFRYFIRTEGFPFHSIRKSGRYFGSMTFNAVAGHTYEIEVDRISGKFWYWLVDSTIDRVVAGQKSQSKQ